MVAEFAADPPERGGGASAGTFVLADSPPAENPVSYT